MMIDRIEKETGTLTAFINGAIGDVGPRLTNGCTVGNIAHVEELGSCAAFDAMQLVNGVKSFTLPEMIIKHGDVHLPYQKYPPLEEIQSELAAIEDPAKLININRLRYEHLTAVKELLESGNDRVPEHFTYPVMTAVIGNIVLLPFPFEIFSGISMRLRAYSGYQHTLCLSCANGYHAYLPTEDQLCLGGYEVGVFRYASVYRLADNTDEHIINEMLRILESPTLPAWERPITCGTPILAEQFQSTLPAWGTTRALCVPRCRVQISIHAPRMGNDDVTGGEII